MKKNKILVCSVMLLLTLSISGCSLIGDNSSGNNISSNNSETSLSESGKTSESVSNSEDLKESENTSNSTEIEDSNSSIESESNNSSIESDTSENNKPQNLLLDFYSINDFHGRVNENTSESAPGISKLSSYIDERRNLNPNGSVFIDVGDTWQDTYESGENKGSLLSEWMEEVKFDAKVLGNHDFDWGLDVIKNNQKLCPSVPFLAANVYNYDNSKKTNIDQASDLGKEYVIIERENVKIGIIGTIGSTQNTSITSSNWENLSFLNTTYIVQQLSDELRTEKNCDVVVWANHADYDYSDSDNITLVSPVSNHKYVDAVFNAHSHQEDEYLVNDVPFIQAGSHGMELGHIQLSYNNGNVSYVQSGNIGLNTIQYMDEKESVNTIKAKYYTDEYEQEKNEEVGNIASGSYISTKTIGNLLAKATYEIYPDQMKDVDIVINNGGRNKGTSGSQTRESIFNMIPFTNYTYVCKNISGQDIINEVINYSSNCCYIPNGDTTIYSDHTYTVAVIDYMLLHKDANRQYNYFPSYDASNVSYIIKDYSVDIVCNWLKTNKSISYNNLNGTNFTAIQG